VSAARIGARLFGRALLIGTLACLLAHLAARGIIARSEPAVLTNTTGYLARATGGAEALPTLFGKGDRPSLLIGAAALMNGFSAEQFDARLRSRGLPSSTYNLTSVSFNPEHTWLMAKRVVAAARQKGERLATVIVNFCPATATLAYNKRSEVLKRAALAAPIDLMRALSDGNGAELLGVRLLGGVGPSELRTLLEAQLRPPTLRREEQLRAGLLDAQAGARGARRPAWDPARRGDFQLRTPETAGDYDELLALNQTPKSRAMQVKRFVGANDLKELRFSEKKIDHFVEAVRLLSSVGDCVIVVVEPVRQPEGAPSAEGQGRLDAVLRRVERETGAKTIDLTTTDEITDEDWFDLLLLNETTGRTKLTTILADRVAEATASGCRTRR